MCDVGYSFSLIKKQFTNLDFFVLFYFFNFLTDDWWVSGFLSSSNYKLKAPILTSLHLQHLFLESPFSLSLSLSLSVSAWDCAWERNHHHQLGRSRMFHPKKPSTMNSHERPMCVQGDSGLVLTTDPKPRLRWTVELHERFVDAVTQLGGPDSTYLYLY